MLLLLKIKLQLEKEFNFNMCNKFLRLGGPLMCVRVCDMFMFVCECGYVHAHNTCA